MSWLAEYKGEYSFTENCAYINVFVHSDVFEQGRGFLKIKAYTAEDARMKLERYLVDNGLEPYSSVLECIKSDFADYFANSN